MTAFARRRGLGRKLAPPWSRSRLRPLVLVGAALVLGAKTPALAQGCGTTVPAGVVVAQHWTTVGSPYCVTGDIQVSLLTIDPGVEVLVDGPFRIDVLSKLTAIGSQAQPIVFRAKALPTRWKGLKFQNSPCISTLIWCEISGSEDSGIELTNTAPRIERCTITDNTNIGSGGGVSATLARGDLTLRDCTISDNLALSGHGGGVYASLALGDLRLAGCTLSGNQANPNLAGGTYGGGGVYVDGDSWLDDCNLLDNIATGNAGFNAFGAGRGGGLFSRAGTCTVERTKLLDNSASVVCTGAFCQPFSQGAGVWIDSGQLVMRNTTVGCNQCLAGTIEGAGVTVATGTALFENCTIARNSHHGIFMGSGSSGLNVRNSILYNNNASGSQISLGGGTSTICYSDIQNGSPAPVCVGNKDVNPVFASTDCSDLRILLGSSCIDSGDPAPLYNDRGPDALGGVRNDMGATGGARALAELACCVQRNGTSVNPQVLACITQPIVGANWMVALDCAGHAPGMAFLVGRDRSTTGPTIAAGQVLIDPCSFYIGTVSMAHAGNQITFNIGIPNQSSLVGVSAFFQGVILGAPGAQLVNALDIVVGL